MMFILGTLSVGLIALLLIVLAAKTDRRTIVVNLLITLCGTFIGVLFAASLASRMDTASQRQVFFASVEHTRDELDLLSQYAEQQLFLIQNAEAGFSGAKPDETMFAAPLLLDNLLTANEFAKFAAWGRTPMLNERYNLKKIRSLMMADTRGDQTELHLSLYRNQLVHLSRILQVITDYNRGLYNDREARAMLDDLAGQKVFGSGR